MVKVRVVMQPLRIGRLFVVLEHKETQTSDHILHNADRYLHLIQYVTLVLPRQRLTNSVISPTVENETILAGLHGHRIQWLNNENSLARPWKMYSYIE